MFAVIEQQEPHAGRMAFEAIAQPATFAERCALAQRLRDELEVPLPIYVDGMDDASRALFSDLPSPAFLLDRTGRIADKLPWADPEPLARAIQRLLRNDRPLPIEKTAMWMLEQRVVFAQRALAAGKRDAALAWLDAMSQPSPLVPPTFVAMASAALTRVQALTDDGTEARTNALEAARASIAAAWPEDQGRLLAARVQLAEAAAGLPLAEVLWQEARDGLDARAPELTRRWLESKAPSKPR